MTDALAYEITNDALKQKANEMRKDCTVDTYRGEILKMTASTLDKHEYFGNVVVNAEDFDTAFREHELIAVMSAMDALIDDLHEHRNTSRLQHLKAAITGGVQ